MVTGHVMFQGLPAQVMYLQHQRRILTARPARRCAAAGRRSTRDASRKRPGAPISEPSRTCKGDTDGSRRYRGRALVPLVPEPTKTVPTDSRIGTGSPSARPGPEQNFRGQDSLSQEAKFLAERKTSLFWIVPGQTRMSTSLQSLHGLGSGSPRSSTIGSDEWLPIIIALHNSYLAGLSIGKARAEALHPGMN